MQKILLLLILISAGCSTNHKSAFFGETGETDRFESASSMDVPETFQARINRLNIQGISAFKDGRNKVAETLFANVLLLDKQNQEARFNLGYLHYTQSNYSLATTFFAPLYNETYTPDSANLPLLYGYSLCKTGMPNRGVIIIQKGMKEMSDTQRIAAVNTVEKCLKINHRR